MRVNCEKCKEDFQAPLAPCPDGREHCAVAHYNAESFICPHCGHDCGPMVRKAFSEGPYVEEPGVSFVNIKAVAKAMK